MTQFTATFASPATENAIAIANEANASFDCDVTVTSSEVNLNQFGDSKWAWPAYMARAFVPHGVTNGNANSRLHWAPPIIDWYTYYGDGYLNGGMARVYRIVNNKVELIRTDTIQNCACRPVQSALGWTHGKYNYVTGTSCEWTIWGGGLHSEYYLRVAAIDANGDRGPWSAQLALTPIVTSSPSNATQSTGPTYSGSDGAALEAPVNFATAQNGSVYDLAWDAVQGAIGYIVEFCEETEFDNAGYIELAGDEASAVSDTDLVIVTKEYEDMADVLDGSSKTSAQSWDRHRNFTTHDIPTWGKSGKNYTTKQGYDNDGIPYLTVDVPVGETLTHQMAAYAGAAQDYYDVLEPGVTYYARINARKTAGAGSLTYGFSRVDQSGSHFLPLTGSFADYDIPFSRSTLDDPGALGLPSVNFIGPVTVDIRYWYAYDGRKSPLADFKPGELAAMDGAGYEFIRTHEFCKTNPWSYDFKRLVGPVGCKGTSGTTLQSSLEAHRAQGANPWLQIEWHWKDQDWLDFAEFMCATYEEGNGDTPASKPWAYRRHQMGQAAPWIDEFPKLRLELGNEQWNLPINEMYGLPGFSGKGFGACNALMTDYAIEKLRSSPYWDDTKWEYVLGGWGGNINNYNGDMAEHSHHAHYIMRSAYIYPFDPNVTLPNPDIAEHWAHVLTSGYKHLSEATALQEICDNVASNSAVARTMPMKAGIYEANHERYGWILGRTAGAMENWEALVDSVGGATALLDLFLSSNAAGSVSNNIFALSSLSPNGYSTHSRFDRGGKPRPSMMWCNLMAEHLSGGTLREVEFSKVSTFDTTALSNIPTLGIWRIDRGAKTYIAALNRSLAKQDVLVHVPNKSPIRRHFIAVTGAHADEPYKATNLTSATSDDVVMSEEAIIGNTIPLSIRLRAGMAEIYEMG